MGKCSMNDIGAEQQSCTAVNSGSYNNYWPKDKASFIPIDECISQSSAEKLPFVVDGDKYRHLYLLSSKETDIVYF